MPIRMSVYDVRYNELNKRDSADHSMITFDTPSSIPDILEQVSKHRSTQWTRHATWSLHRDDVEPNANFQEHILMKAATDKLVSNGDGRIPYLFCFQHNDTHERRRLFGRDLKVHRRNVFKVKFGSDAKGQQYYDELA